MKFPKSKRFVSKDNLKLIKSQRCIIHGCQPPSDAHHLRTVKSGGGDQLWNLVAVCRFAHQEFHFRGIKSMINLYRLPITFEDGWPRRTDIK